MADGLSVKLRGLDELIASLEDLKKATQRNVMRRVLTAAAQPVADAAARLAPHETGRLAFSIVVSGQLTRRQRRSRPKPSETEVFIGPAGGLGALIYASFVEFGTVDTPAEPYLRPGWASGQMHALDAITDGLRVEIGKAAARAARKAARIAAR